MPESADIELVVHWVIPAHVLSSPDPLRAAACGFEPGLESTWAYSPDMVTCVECLAVAPPADREPATIESWLAQ